MDNSISSFDSVGAGYAQFLYDGRTYSYPFTPRSNCIGL
jgi:hypothetical protein